VCLYVCKWAVLCHLYRTFERSILRHVIVASFLKINKVTSFSCPLFPISPRSVVLRCSLFWEFARRRLVACDQYFGTKAYRSILQGSKSPRGMHCFEGFQSLPACPSNKRSLNMNKSMEYGKIPLILCTPQVQLGLYWIEIGPLLFRCAVPLNITRNLSFHLPTIILFLQCKTNELMLCREKISVLCELHETHN